MLFLLYIAMTLVGDKHLFQIRTVLFVILYQLEIIFLLSLLLVHQQANDAIWCHEVFGSHIKLGINPIIPE